VFSDRLYTIDIFSLAATEISPLSGKGNLTMSILGNGVYSLAEAARLAQLQPNRVRDWFRLIEGNGSGRSLFKSDYPSVGDDRAISFLDLVEVFIVGRLRESTPPVSLQNIRKVHQKLSLESGQKHPFCTREIYHGQGKIFTRRLGGLEPGSIIEPLTDQLYISEVIIPFLQKIEYDHITNLAKLWRIAEGVVIDPTRCFGKPIVNAVGIATRVLAAAYEANGRNTERVADWYEIDPIHVESAVRFESRTAA
jgi:uncharacterized protein (DUF433 family)